MSTEFWSRFASGFRVVVAGEGPDKLDGVREGFHRYLCEGFGLPVEIRVEARSLDRDGRNPLPLDDREILALARARAKDLSAHEDDFRVGTEAGLLLQGPPGEQRWFVRTWTVVIGMGEEAWGTSGSVQLPVRLIDGLEAADLPFHVPGARRKGGMIESLTGGVEDRKGAIRLSTVHALASLFYPFLESGRVR